MLLAFKTEPKWSKIEVQERSSSKLAPGRFQRQKKTTTEKKKKLFGSRFEVNTRPKNKVCSERSFGQLLASNNFQNEPTLLQSGSQK